MFFCFGCSQPWVCHVTGVSILSGCHANSISEADEVWKTDRETDRHAHSMRMRGGHAVNTI